MPDTLTRFHHDITSLIGAQTLGLRVQGHGNLAASIGGASPSRQADGLHLGTMIAAIRTQNAELIRRNLALQGALDRQSGAKGSLREALSKPAEVGVGRGPTETMQDRTTVPDAMTSGLTERQIEVLQLLLAGHPNKNIAVDLNISQRTVENHRAAIMHRTRATSLPALARMAVGAAVSTDYKATNPPLSAV